MHDLEVFNFVIGENSNSESVLIQSKGGNIIYQRLSISISTSHSLT